MKNTCKHEECYWFSLDDNIYKEDNGEEYKYIRVVCIQCGDFWDEKDTKENRVFNKYITRATFRKRKFEELHKLLQEIEDLSKSICTKNGYEK